MCVLCWCFTMSIPGTLEVSAVWTVGGGATGAGCAATWCIGVIGPTGGATVWAILELRYGPTCEGMVRCESGTGYALYAEFADR